MTHTRRRLLTALAATGIGGLSGCIGGPDDSTGTGGDPASSDPTTTAVSFQADLGVPCEETTGTVDLSGGKSPTEIEAARASDETGYEDGEIPLREEPLHLGHELATLRDNQQSGGVGHDGIPSIDAPKFAHGTDVSMPACERVFGIELDGDVRAYPQRILVSHEVVNDVVGGKPVAVTYCPLTGTAQGFYRGGVVFGVSGRLVNSNLIMWDREFDVRWPQIAGTAIEVGGEVPKSRGDQLIGKSLTEFPVTWTTWQRWSEKHPNTLVLTTETGYARNYNRDPYGSYTPVSGHYALDTGRRPNFPLIASTDGPEKRVVLGARTTEGAIAFDKRTLLQKSVLQGTIRDTAVVAVAEQDLATGYLYANPDGVEITAGNGGINVDGERVAPTELPLERIRSFDAMWFAWYAYYPDTARVGL